jgi:hypothetical protein
MESDKKKIAEQEALITEMRKELSALKAKKPASAKRVDDGQLVTLPNGDLYHYRPVLDEDGNPLPDVERPDTIKFDGEPQPKQTPATAAAVEYALGEYLKTQGK